MLVRRDHELSRVPHQIIGTLTYKCKSQRLTFKVNIVHQDHDGVWFEVFNEAYNFPFGLLPHMTVDLLLGCRNIGEVGGKDLSLIEALDIIQKLCKWLQLLPNEFPTCNSNSFFGKFNEQIRCQKPCWISAIGMSVRLNPKLSMI